MDRVVWARHAESGKEAATLTAVSPSDAGIAQAHAALAEMLPIAGATKRRVQPPSPNHFSVAMWLEVGTVRCLLGADLERTGDPTTGWLAVVNECRVAHGDAADLFKVPHHGSLTGYERRVWDELLTESPHAVLTPFIQGRVALPTEDDRGRICARTSNAYTTSTGGPVGATGRAQSSERSRRQPATCEMLTPRWGRSGFVETSLAPTATGAWKPLLRPLASATAAPRPGGRGNGAGRPPERQAHRRRGD